MIRTKQKGRKEPVGQDDKKFTFWHNSDKKSYVMTLGELKTKYLEWLKTKEIVWVIYYGHGTVTTFVTTKEGLDSSIDVTALLKLETALTKTRHSLFPPQKK